MKTNGRKVPPRYFNGIFEISSLNFLNKKMDTISNRQFWLVKHFLFRSGFYLILSAGCFLNIATHLAFFGYGVSGIIYLLAFIVVGSELKMDLKNMCLDPEKSKRDEVTLGRSKLKGKPRARIQSHGMKRGSICYFDRDQIFKPKAERNNSKMARRASSARQIGVRKLKLMLSLQKSNAAGNFKSPKESVGEINRTFEIPKV